MSVIIQRDLMDHFEVVLDEGPGMRQKMRLETVEEAAMVVLHYYADRRIEKGMAHLRASVEGCPICCDLLKGRRIESKRHEREKARNERSTKNDAEVPPNWHNRQA